MREGFKGNRRFPLLYNTHDCLYKINTGKNTNTCDQHLYHTNTGGNHQLGMNDGTEEKSTPKPEEIISRHFQIELTRNGLLQIGGTVHECLLHCMSDTVHDVKQYPMNSIF